MEEGIIGHFLLVIYVGIVGVPKGMYRLGVVSESGVGGMDDAAGGVVMSWPPQLHGAFGVFDDGIVFQFEIALDIVAAVDFVLVYIAVPPDFYALPHKTTSVCDGCSI